ncbi:hypothetical protein D0869_13442, partial [Hortaea werneckii]
MEIDDSEVLRRVAARRSTTGVATAKAQNSTQVPRSVPAQAIASPPRASTAEGQVALKAGTAAPSFNDGESTSAGPITERNTNTMLGNKGTAPSLKGDPDALKEARDFFQATSKSKMHSRAPRAASSMSSTPPARNALFRAPKAETPPLSAENVRPEVSKWADFSATHNKPASLRSAPNPTFTSDASHTSSSGLSTPTTTAAEASKTKVDSVDDITSALRSTSIKGDSPGAKLAPKTQTKGAGLFDRQITGVKNTFKELKSEMPPPHLRGKAFDQGQSPKTTPSTPVGKSAEVANGTKPPITPEASSLAIAGSPQPMLPSAAPAASSNTVTKIEAAAAGISAESEAIQKQFHGPILQETKKSEDSAGKKTNPISPNPDIFDTRESTQSTTVGADGDGSSIYAKMQKDVKELIEKLKGLEAAYVEMEHQLEQLVKKDERRRFMGTGDINTPFVIDVAYPDGTKRAIQVSVGLKVADLIRRCRVDAKIETGTTSNPRVAVDGSFIGHGQLLGEVNVTRGTNKFVAFHAGTSRSGKLRSSVTQARQDSCDGADGLHLDSKRARLVATNHPLYNINLYNTGMPPASTLEPAMASFVTAARPTSRRSLAALQNSRYPLLFSAQRAAFSTSPSHALPGPGESIFRSSSTVGGPPSTYFQRSTLPANTVVKFVPQQTAWIVERMGRFNRILQPGLAI